MLRAWYLRFAVVAENVLEVDELNGGQTLHALRWRERPQSERICFSIFVRRALNSHDSKELIMSQHFLLEALPYVRRSAPKVLHSASAALTLFSEDSPVPHRAKDLRIIFSGATIESASTSINLIFLSLTCFIKDVEKRRILSFGRECRYIRVCNVGTTIFLGSLPVLIFN